MIYTRNEDEKNNKQKLYAKAFAGFFIFMLIFTVLSRAADSVAVAKVYTEKAKMGKLSHETVCEGSIKPREKQYISSEEGFRIQEVKVEPGQSVTKEEPLIILDSKDIEEQLFAAEKELELLELKEQGLYLNTYNTPDYSAVEKAQAELQRTQRDMELNKEINGGMVLEADKRAVEDASFNLQAAIDEKEKAEADNKAASEKNEVDIKTVKVEIELKNNEINHLKELLRQECVITAKKDGTIDEIYIKAGEKTSGGNLISFIPEDSEYYFIAETDKENVQTIKQGDLAEITLKGKKTPIKNAEVKWMRMLESGKMEIAVEIPGNNELYMGMSASMKHIKHTDEYEKIIPLSSLRSNTNGDYVLAVKDVNTVMGNETDAYKIFVEVLDKDGANAAVKGLNNEDIIVSGNKPVEDSDRVRVMKK